MIYEIKRFIRLRWVEIVILIIVLGATIFLLALCGATP